MEGDSSQSVTAWGINVGSRLASGVSKIYANIFTGGSPRSPPKTATSGLPPASPDNCSGGDMGIVTVLDTVALSAAAGEGDNYAARADEKAESGLAAVAHFVAHAKAIVALQVGSHHN
jgi:hypothetical protein